MAVTQAGELFSLADVGIASISVNGTAQQNVFQEGNQITATGTFTRINGTTGTIADVLYRVDNAYTYYAGDPIAITAHAAALPERRATPTTRSRISRAAPSPTRSPATRVRTCWMAAPAMIS